MLGVPTHQPQRPGWRGCSTSAQLLGARLRPLAHTQPRADSAGKVAGRGGGKDSTYRVWGLDFGQGWQQSEAGQTVSPTGDGQFGQGLRRGWGGGKGEGRKTPVRLGVPLSLALARAPRPRYRLRRPNSAWPGEAPEPASPPEVRASGPQGLWRRPRGRWGCQGRGRGVPALWPGEGNRVASTDAAAKRGSPKFAAPGCRLADPGLLPPPPLLSL